jgi:hypothetical protein
MDDMVDDIGRGYDLESEDPPSEVQNFYKLLATSEEKVHVVLEGAQGRHRMPALR